MSTILKKTQKYFMFLLFISVSAKDYDTAFEWSVINFTWPSKSAYKSALSKKQYIPENNQVAGLKIYKNNAYIAMPRTKSGTPVTLGTFSMKEKTNKDILIKPYPSWEMNVKKDCSTLQNIRNIEIDSDGILYALDGVRGYNLTDCPTKLVMIDLNKKGKVVHVHEFPKTNNREYLNDIVVDETDGGYAYITDSSDIDPGLIIFSKSDNASWKVRDSSMFSEKNLPGFWVGAVKLTNLSSIHGLALGRQGEEDDVRTLYYSTLTGLKLFSIPNKILKDMSKCKGAEWRNEIKFVGNKTDHSDSLTMDNKGNLYFGMLSQYGISQWNTNKPLNTSKVIAKNKKDIVWPSSFAFDNSGNMYVVTGSFLKTREKDVENNSEKELVKGRRHKRKGKQSKYKIIKIRTKSDSYIYFGEGDK